ncbi:MAG TPA: rhodanese-like domain-containing protein [Thermoanaerobaculia bacterium]|jgi:rhodanese-related sulfurtransferase|nr:rhodanese-like domain-containing protein [Thermoanaerobaculia bacterium]
MDPHFDGVIFKTHAGELIRRRRRPYPPFCVVDARWRGDYEEGHIPGAFPAGPDGPVSLPPGTTPGTEFFVVGSGAEDPAMRKVSLALRRLGAHRVVELTGGMVEWRLAGGPIESSRQAA